MRLTRATLRAEATQNVEIDSQTVDASNPHLDPRRVPLGEVSANTPADVAETEAAQPTKMPAKRTKTKGGAKKGAKGKKGKAVEEGHVQVVEVLGDEQGVPGSPASDATADELAKPPTNDIVQIPMDNERPATPPPRAVRMTRRQLAKQEELSRSHHATSPPREPESVAQEASEETDAGPQEGEAEIAEPQHEPVAAPEQEVENTTTGVADHQEVESQQPEADPVESEEPEVATPEAPVEEEPEFITPSVEITSEPEPKTLTSEKPCDEESTPATSCTPSRVPSRSPSRSPAKTPMGLEESIGAIDALEEALENVGKAFADLDQSVDGSSTRKARFPRAAAATAPTASGKTAKTSPVVPRVSKNPNVAPKSLKPTAARQSIGRSASTRAASSKETRKGSAEVVDYLASKRRPISMSFPTPPPPSKSTKPPTQSTFQLPGDAIAAKLKAQKEERLKRETEGEVRKARPISMPPRPKSTKPPTRSNFQLPGEAIAAKLKAQKEERQKREVEGTTQKTHPTRPLSMPPPPKSSKPPTIPNFQLPGEAVAAKLKAQREERLKREADEAEAAQRTAFKARPAPVRKPVAAPVRQSSAMHVHETLTVNGPGRRTSSLNRYSTILPTRSVSTSSGTSSNRNSIIMNPGPVSKSTVTPADAVAQKLKGKEVFNRDKLEKEARERERRDKEDAAKRARAEAAERGRIASREWAEKQRKKFMAAAQKLTAGAA